MPRALRNNRVAVHRFAWEVAGLAYDEHNGFNQVYRAGSCLRQTGYVLTIGTDWGPVGEYVGGAHYGEFVQPKRRRAYREFGAKRTGVSVDAERSQCPAMPFEAMPLTMAVGFS